jgi:hypothetical protein
MKRSLSHLKMLAVGPWTKFAISYNKLVDEIERATNLEVTEPLLLRDNGQSGKTLTMIPSRASASAVAVSGSSLIFTGQINYPEPRLYILAGKLPSCTLVEWGAVTETLDTLGTGGTGSSPISYTVGFTPFNSEFGPGGVPPSIPGVPSSAPVGQMSLTTLNVSVSSTSSLRLFPTVPAESLLASFAYYAKFELQ